MRGKMPRLSMAQAIIETARLLLRVMTWDDLDFIATMLADPRVMRHYPKCCSRDEAEQWVGRVIERHANHGHSFYLVSLNSSGEPIGQVGLLRQHVEGVDESEIGYLIHAPYWRQGFAVEAATAVRDFAFHTLDRERVISMIRPANIPSQRVAFRLGMKPEKMTTWHDREHLVFATSRVPPGGPSA